MANPKGPAASKGPRPRLFLSGPMGSRAEVEGQKAVRAALRSTCNVYLAPTDGVEIEPLIDLIADPSLASQTFLRAALLVQQIGWAQEMHQLLTCDVLVMNMDGRVPDEGAVVEASTAYMTGKPVVIFKDTAVTYWNYFDNPMLAALDTTWKVVHRLDDLPAAVHAALATAAKAPAYDYVPPANIAAAFAFGTYVHKNMKVLMEALTFSAKHLSSALRNLEPDMGSMQQFAEALIAETKVLMAEKKPAAATRAVAPPTDKVVAAAVRRAARTAFA